MAIRIRKVGNRVVALCAAKTKPVGGDVYLDDAMHEALSTKFAIDWEEFLSVKLCNKKDKQKLQNLERGTNRDSKNKK